MTRRTYLGLAGAVLTASALGIAGPAPDPDAAGDSRADLGHNDERYRRRMVEGSEW